MGDEGPEQLGLISTKLAARGIESSLVLEVDDLAIPMDSNARELRVALGCLLDTGQEFLNRIFSCLLGLLSLRNSFCNCQESDAHDEQEHHHQRTHQVSKGNPERLLCLVLEGLL